MPEHGKAYSILTPEKTVKAIKIAGLALAFALGIFSGLAITQLRRESKAARRPVVASDSVERLKCSFTHGPFSGNHFIYEIRRNPLKVKLVEALDGKDVISENYEPVMISRKDDVITVADPRLLDSEKTIYIDKIDLKEMRLSSSALYDFGSNMSTVENYLLGCQRS